MEGKQHEHAVLQQNSLSRPKQGKYTHLLLRMDCSTDTQGHSTPSRSNGYFGDTLWRGS